MSKPFAADRRYQLFGPVLSDQVTEEDVIALANDTRHGLAAGIFTRDSARSLRVAKAVRAGIVWVNTYRAISPIAEFGGTKTSMGVKAAFRRSMIIRGQRLCG